jgi:hypothetical protein
MAKTLQHSLAAVLVSTAMALAAPAYAATKHHEGTKTTHVSKGHKGKMSATEMRERRTTARLNLDQLRGTL